MFENPNLEYKSEFVPELKKTFVAFANTDGGEILIGVDDNGQTIGLQDPDSTLQQVINSIRDNVHPQLAQFFYAEITLRDEKPIVRVTIRRGALRPYYISGKGIRPEGVFVRKGSETVSASSNEILEMIKVSSGQDYEKTISFSQQLTFHTANTFFEQLGKTLDETTMKTIGAMTTDGLYTNLGLLFSDQCPFCTKFGRFNTNSTTGEELFVDQKVVEGSIFKQLLEAEDWFNLVNKTGAEISGFFRKDYRDYPPRALREVFINALVHRDYALNGPTLVNVYEDEIEIISIGGLVKGLNMDDVMLGISRPRNILLASTFVKLRLVEGWGRGIREIEKLYRQNSSKPSFTASTHGFKVVLPKLDLPTESRQFRASETAAERILKYLETQGESSREQIQSGLKLPQATCLVALRQLTHDERILKIRDGRKITYTLPN